MADRRVRILAGALLALVAAGLLTAHPEDPRSLVRTIPYVGPGYRSGGAGPGAEPGAGEPGPAMFPHHGIRLMAWLPLGDFEEVGSGNDCWGYTSPSGREYALMGLRRGLGVAEITDPGDPQVLAVIDGPPSTWRDIKVLGPFAYVVTEGAGGGIQVVDLRDIDSGAVTLVRTVLDDVADPMLATGSTHNVAIDTESGFLYRCGGGNNGLRIYSLADPANPVYVAAWSERYVHDAQIVTYFDGPYAGRQIAYCCSGLSGGSVQTGLDVLDVTDKQNIVNLARLQYSGAVYSHQTWLSEDRRYLYLNDEGDETSLGIPTTTKVFDVSDPADPIELMSFTNGLPSIGHNLYVHNGMIFEANYTSGVRVFDAANPEAPVEFAFFDTFPEDDAPSFSGAWSVFPFFPSGTFIVSDIERGLFVLRFDDCDGNGLIDGDEIEADPALDCNVNGRLDSCELADGSATDADGDGVPDECVDCNGNGASDLIDVQRGSSDDCNGNGVPDECEEDCNGNGVPDDCDVRFFMVATGPLSPVEPAAAHDFVVAGSPEPLSDVRFVFRASAALEGATSNIDVLLNGFFIFTIFGDDGTNCPDDPDVAVINYGRAMFRILRGFDPEGDLNFQLVASDTVGAGACGGESFVSMSLQYVAALGNDLNGNGVPDECDPPLCQGREATVYVDADGVIVGGHFDGLPYFGILLGTPGNDVIVGTPGPERDVIIGLDGDDVVCALDGDDIVNGNDGDDAIDGGEGFDHVHGNGGTDTCTNGEQVAGCENGDKPRRARTIGDRGLNSRR